MSGTVKKFFQKPVTGSVLMVAAGLSFFFTCMLLPLVGRAGVRVSYADKNEQAFLGALGLTLLLAVLATGSKMIRRREDQSPLPVWSLVLCAVCVALFALQQTGLLAI